MDSGCLFGNFLNLPAFRSNGGANLNRVLAPSPRGCLARRWGEMRQILASTEDHVVGPPMMYCRSLLPDERQRRSNKALNRVAGKT